MLDGSTLLRSSSILGFLCSPCCPGSLRYYSAWAVIQLNRTVVIYDPAWEAWSLPDGHLLCPGVLCRILCLWSAQSSVDKLPLAQTMPPISSAASSWWHDAWSSCSVLPWLCQAFTRAWGWQSNTSAHPHRDTAERPHMPRLLPRWQKCWEPFPVHLRAGTSQLVTERRLKSK